MTGDSRAEPGSSQGVSAARGLPHVLIAHPSPDVYGSDLLMAQTVSGLASHGWQTTLIVPARGPLIRRLHPGVDVHVERFPVLRRSALNPRTGLALFGRILRSMPGLVRLIRSVGPDVVYVNTVTIPWWVVAARLARVPVVVHVREAEERWPRLVRWLLTAPLLLASLVVTNSQASRRVLLESVSRLGRRTEVIYNGMAGPPELTAVAESGSAPVRLALVARLSPRKGVDVALDALALLRAQGRDVVLDVCGTAYSGYEWFETQLRERAARADLAGAVRFLGYVNPTWPLLASATVVLVPSRVEPFGNTAVEGLLAGRPVVASKVQGLAEIVTDGRTGLSVPPGDAPALADAIGRLLDDPELAARLAEAGRDEAIRRFSVERYQTDIESALQGVCR